MAFVDEVTRNLSKLSFWVSVVLVVVIFQMVKQRGLLAPIGIPAGG